MSRSPPRVNVVYTCETKPGTTMVFTLVPVISRPWTTSGVAKRSVTRRPCGTARQRGTNMNCVAMARTVTPPSAPTVVPRFCSANSPERCSVFGSMCSTLLGGFMSLLSAVNTIMPRTAATSTPTPNAHSNSVPRTRRSCVAACCSLTGLAHGAAWQEDQQVDREVANHQQGNGGPGQHSGSERHDPHHPAERSFVDVISDLGRGGRGGRLIDSGHSTAPLAAPVNCCDVEF